MISSEITSDELVSDESDIISPQNTNEEGREMKALSVLVLAGFLLLVAACFTDDETHPGKKGEIDWIEIAETIGAGKLPEPNSEQHREYEIKREQAQKEWNQAELARLTKIAAAFDKITLKPVAIEDDFDGTGSSLRGFYLAVRIENQTDDHHSTIWYLVSWQARLVKQSFGCPVEDQAPSVVTGEEKGGIISLGPRETVEDKLRITITNRRCSILELTVDPPPTLTITNLDGFKSKEEVEAAIAQLQTSPGN
ncbi:MAG: hypothetical protein A2Z24_02045 [Candidatus Woykebacteria bacterium RBG_16_44_10]|uniref:Uncharacterized protein n=1 Tax=Candidatus Woykebacteria bacterium RBG_16_44_10 TaxID=1802597 RepID=A0A1G1WGB5_9BACT|nr:MAG: hypothetical protein A2Z24_02045 [Candidatus Woykebacteria bacterium RBG_16_44_10]